MTHEENMVKKLCSKMSVKMDMNLIAKTTQNALYIIQKDNIDRPS